MDWIDITIILLGQTIITPFMINLILLNRFDEIKKEIEKIRQKIF